MDVSRVECCVGRLQQCIDARRHRRWWTQGLRAAIGHIKSCKVVVVVKMHVQSKKSYFE